MIECRYYGRDFTTEEMVLLRTLSTDPPALNRHALSKEFCRYIGWFKPVAPPPPPLVVTQRASKTTTIWKK